MMSFAKWAPLKLIIGSPSLRRKFQREIIPEILGSENMRQIPKKSMKIHTYIIFETGMRREAREKKKAAIP
jgi:hypothetical protein